MLNCLATLCIGTAAVSSQDRPHAVEEAGARQCRLYLFATKVRLKHSVFWRVNIEVFRLNARVLTSTRVSVGPFLCRKGFERSDHIMPHQRR